MVETYIRPAGTPQDIDTVRRLLRDYGDYLRASQRAYDMDFAKYEEELLSLPGPYTLLLAFVTSTSGEDEPAGCVALKSLPAKTGTGATEKACELKRLWVLPRFRGLGLGRQLTEFSISEAKRQGFDALYLDTIPDVMVAANHLYERMGFRQVDRYNDNPVADVKFFRLSL